jgi:hypothetical protein
MLPHILLMQNECGMAPPRAAYMFIAIIPVMMMIAASARRHKMPRIVSSRLLNFLLLLVLALVNNPNPAIAFAHQINCGKVSLALVVRYEFNELFSARFVMNFVHTALSFWIISLLFRTKNSPLCSKMSKSSTEHRGRYFDSECRLFIYMAV